MVVWSVTKRMKRVLRPGSANASGDPYFPRVSDERGFDDYSGKRIHSVTVVRKVAPRVLDKD
jgi:hypothetical protein